MPGEAAVARLASDSLSPSPDFHRKEEKTCHFEASLKKRSLGDFLVCLFSC